MGALKSPALLAAQLSTRLALLAWAGISCAQTDELDALDLGKNDPPLAPAAATKSDGRAVLELGTGWSRERSGALGRKLHTAAQIRWDASLGEPWRYVFDYRLDGEFVIGEPLRRGDWLSSLREAYLTRAMAADQWLDLGRINVKGGVGLSYNPSDFFREKAQLTGSNPDPAALRDNRLGTWALRAQKIWPRSSLSLLYSPQLKTPRLLQDLNLGLDKTNAQDRWLLRASYKFNESLNPEWLLLQRGSGPPELGFNLSVMATESIQLFSEWRLAKSLALASQAMPAAISPLGQSLVSTKKHWHQQASLGLSWIGPNKFSLMFEWLLNQEGLNRADWLRLSQASGPAQADYWALRSYAGSSQNPVTQGAWMLRAAWADALLDHLDFTGFVRANPYDASLMLWLEVRYHFDRADLALSYTANRGRSWSEFGVLPVKNALSLNLSAYF